MIARVIAKSTFASGVGESIGGKDAEAGDALASSMQADAVSGDCSQHDAEKASGNRSEPNASRRKGAAAVELALALPLVLILIVGGLDYALQFHTLHCMNRAARNAARHLAVRDGTPQEATSIALDELSGLHAPFSVSAAQPAPSDPNRDVTVRISVERSEVSLGLFDSGEMQVEVTMRKEEE